MNTNESSSKALVANQSFNENNTSTNNISDAEISEIYNDSILQMLDEPFDLLLDKSKLRTDEAFYGFDNHTGDTWIYPSNYPIRQYQYNITKASLFRNTLVALPTGLGKTFIAAVVMYNFFRWYPNGKIIFMAPTRPLVAQQIEACYKVMGIPRKDTVEITGKQNKNIRGVLWQSKRVFFATPQTVLSDLCSLENFPFKNIRLLVIDEAHKAKGKYAYTEVIQSLFNRNRWFRVLALSATPGRHIEDVVEVVRNLLISHVEIRWENSIDVSPYVYKRNIKTEVVKLGPRLKSIYDQYITIIDKYIRNLLECNVIQGSTGSLNKISLIMQQKRYRESCRFNQHPKHQQISSDLSSAISLYHALELLELHGLRSFLHFFDDATNFTKEKFFVAKDQELKLFLNKLREEAGPNPLSINNQTLPDGSYIEMPNDIDFGHPKFGILEKHLIEHFTTNENSRAIIFSEFRESVQLIHRLLLKNRPKIRPVIIVGKSSTSNGRSVTEKQQKTVMMKFRDGTYNTLIATCVAEEGIDVGEVDLIICFDISTRNPTRFIQRMGRTGRQRKGKVIMLVTEGHEHDVLKDVLANKDKTNQKIVRSTEILKNLYKSSPRLIPTEFDPKCIETLMKINEPIVQTTLVRVPETSKIKSPKIKKTNNKNSMKGLKDVRDFFKKINFDPYEAEIFTPPPDYQKNKSIDIEVFASSQAIATVKPRSPDSSKHLIRKLMREQKTFINSKIDNNSNKKRPTKFLKIEQIIRNDNEKFDLFKKIALRLNPEFILDKLDSESVLEALDNFNGDNNEDDDDVIILDPEVENLKKDLQIIDFIFDGRENLKKFIVNFKEMKRYITNLSDINIKQYHFNSYNSKVNLNKINLIKKSYEELKTQMYNEKSSIKNKIDDIDNEDNFSSNSDNDTIIFNDESKYRKFNNQEDEYHHDSTELNFKYQNPVQDSEFINENIICNNSIIETNKFESCALTENSPLLQSFNNSIKKKFNSDNMPRILKKSKAISTLLYFGLNDIDDLFGDDEILSKTDDHDDFDLIQSSQKSISSTFKRSRKLFSSHEQNDTQVDDNKCTVTQILNLIESKQDKKENFHIGSVDDLFGSDEDDLFADCDDDIVENKSQSPEETQKYDIEEILCNKSKYSYENSSDLFDTSSMFAGSSKRKSGREIKSLVTIVENQKNESTESLKENKSPDNDNIQIQSHAEASPPPTIDLTQHTSPSIFRSRRPNYKKLLSKYSVTEKSQNLQKDETNLQLICARISPSSPSNFVSNKEESFQFTQIPAVRLNKKRRIIESSDEDDKFDRNGDACEVTQIFIPNQIQNQETQMFIPQSNKIQNQATQQFFPKSNKIQLQATQIFNPKSNQANRKKRRKCEFIDDEAQVSDDNNINNNDEEAEPSQTQIFHLDSIIDRSFDEEELEDHENMHAVYLNSIKDKNVGRFKIPEKLNKNIYTNIFSQVPEQDETYRDFNDSFVVDENDSQIESEDEDCPLERAEKILKEKRKARRKLKNSTENVKRRKIILNSYSTDEDEEENEEIKAFRKQLEEEDNKFL